LFHDDASRAYAMVSVAGHVEVLPVGSKPFKRWLSRAYYHAQGGAPPTQAMSEALGLIEAKSLYDGPEREVFIRVGADADRSHIYLDLGDRAWRVVEIGPDGWKVLDRSPVPMRRSPGLRALPTPREGGSIDTLRRFLNLPDDDAWRLLVAWLAATLRPTGPYPVLVVLGEQGSAKSFLSRLVRGTVDPNAAPLRSGPRNEHDLSIAANASWVLAFDNLDRIPPWLSDALCRLATGGGFGTRTLYTDDEETLFTATRPTLLNGIDAVATRPDLLDRAIVLKLLAIPDEQRKEESVLMADYVKQEGAILGALLDAVSAALRLLPSVHPESLTRMADFARFGEAFGWAHGWGENTFLDAYRRNIGAITEAVAEGSAVATAVQGFMAERSEWEGLPGDLLRELSAFVGEQAAREKGWPAKPNRLTPELTRFAPTLRRLGIHISRPARTKKGNPVRLSRTPPLNPGNPSPPVPPPPPGPENRGPAVEMPSADLHHDLHPISTPGPFEISPCGGGGAGGDGFPGEGGLGEEVCEWTG
jgi:hypothetical protein